jgi:pilus assembly protein FimV
VIRYKTKLLPLLISALFVSIPSVEAAQLGKITVVSKPDQNFAAQILVERVLPGERESLKVALATPEAFAAARLTVDPNLSKLRFSIKDGVAPGTAIIDVSSSAPIPAGFIDALLELSWAGGKVTREYTLSIPIRTTTPAVTPVLPEVGQQKPGGQATAPSSSAPVAPAVSPAAKPAAPPQPAAVPPAAAPAVSAPASASQAAPAAAPVAAPPVKPIQSSEPKPKVDPVIEKTLKIKRGNTLSELALDYVGDGVTLNQAMAALFEANPEAFINGSIHLLKPGAELRIPNRSSIRSRSKNEALVILAGGDDRNDFSREAKQLGLLTVARQDDIPGKQQAAGQIEQGRAKQISPAGEQDRLKIAPGVTDGNTKAKLDRAAEELIAKEKSLAEANERIALLERNVSDLQRLLELQNKAGAAAPQASGASPANPADSSAGAVSAAPAAPQDGVSDPSVAPSSEPVAETPTEAPSEAPVTPPTLAVEKEPADPSQKPEPAESVDSSLMSNPWVLGGGVGVSLAFLGGLILLLKKRKKSVEPQEDDSEEQNAESFNEALAWATGTGAKDEATQNKNEADSEVDQPSQSANRIEDEIFDLDEILSESPAPTPAPTPEPDKPRAPETFEPAAQVVPEVASPVVDLDFDASDVNSKADVNSIFEDLDDIQKGAEAAKKEIEALRDSTPVPADASEAVDEPESEEVQANASPTADVKAGDLDDIFDQAAAGLDLDLPGAELDAATRQEVDTKLDLAGAYVEIGDSEGASELLKEIIDKGDSAQVKKAKELLASLK